MTVTGHYFGHPVEWVYSDTKESATEGKRPCPKCGKLPTKQGYDPCWGELPNVKAACCGHGVTNPYMILMDGTQLNGQEAIDYATGINRQPLKKPIPALFIKAGLPTIIHIPEKSPVTLKTDETLSLETGGRNLKITIELE